MSSTSAVVPRLALVLCLGAPAAAQLAVQRPLPILLGPAPDQPEAASTRLGPAAEPLVRSSQGPEGFAYEISHPVLDEYGKRGTATQYHAQDGLGRYRYSYRHPGSKREEYVDENGRIEGSYSYKSADEDKISMSYYADDSGFHVKRATLPDLAARAPRDEPAVAAIKAAHIRLWRKMWERAAAASLGAPLGPDEPPIEVYAPIPDEVAPFDIDIISADGLPLADDIGGEPVQDEPVQDELIQDEPAQDEPVQDEPIQDPEPVVPIFPGAPDARPQPVSSAPKPLPVQSSPDLISPDAETVVVEARDASTPGVSRPSQQFPSRPLQRVGALALLRRQGGPPQATLRVSEQALRTGSVPVAARHNLAQVRPDQRPAGRQPAPVLDDPLLYYYSDLLYQAKEAAKPPAVIVV